MTREDVNQMLIELLDEVGVNITEERADHVATSIREAGRYENQGQEVGYGVRAEEKQIKSLHNKVAEVTQERQIYKAFIEAALGAEVFIDVEGSVRKLAG